MDLKDNRQLCKYGEQCYQKNPMHREKFKHPSPKKEESEDKENVESKKRPLPSESSDNEVEEAKKTRTDSVPEEEKPSDVTDSAEEPAKVTEKEEEAEAAKAEETVYEDILPPSPEDIKESIKQKFLVEMPEDFYQFYDFCKGLNKEDPRQALAAAGLKLCGPFDVLAGAIPKEKPRSAALFLRHYRYYYDPPEFQTVITSTDTSEKSSLFHIGYFRDSPREAPVFLASNCAAEGPKITPLSDNLFGAVYQHLAKKMTECDPFLRTKLSGVQEKVKLYANRMIINGDARDISLEAKTASMKLRDRNKVSTTFHGAGLVVPFDKKTDVGYREIPETTASLKKIFTKVVEAESEDERIKALDTVQELITNVQFANDEGDPGMGLELGLDAFSFGGEALHNSIRHLLGVGYELLDRDEFGTILMAHLDNRVKGPNVDMFNA